MTINEHTTHFAGKPVVDWDPAKGLTDPAGTIPRISVDWDEGEKGVRWPEKLARLLGDPSAARLTGLVVGAWESVATGEQEAIDGIVAAIAAARERLPALTAVFVGDVVMEEAEISWIQQGDVSPILDAYPRLEHFRVRGGNGLVLGPLRHPSLKALVVESGGLDASVVRAVGQADLPALEHLELWLGDDGYGATATVEDLQPILVGDRFPRLRYLGLRDSHIADEVAAAVAAAPILQRIRVLDLLLGTLSDAGALALASSPAVARLEKLDIHHHYCSDAAIARLRALGIELDASERQDEDEDDNERYRYVAVSE